MISTEAKQVGWMPIASLTHLVTGWRIAAFADLKEAALAGDLAEKCGDWTALTDPSSSKSPEWSVVNQRMEAAWESNGFHRQFADEDGKPVWAKTAAPVKKAVLDDCGDPLGFGATTEEAKEDAIKTILADRAETEACIRAAVEDLTVVNFSDALVAKFKSGEDVEMAARGKYSFETKEEFEARP
jgi:hypothetical protein